MKKEANFKRIVDSQEGGGKGTSNIELRQFRSSNELLKVFKIKREKVLSNLGGTKAPVTEVEAPCNKQNKPPATKQVSSHAVGVAKQNKGSTKAPCNKQDNPPVTKQVSSQAVGVAKQNKGSTEQVSSQGKGVAQFKLSKFAAADKTHLDSIREPEPTKKISDNASVTQPKVPTQRRTTIEASMARDKGSKRIQDPKSQFLAQGKGPIQIQDSNRQAMKKKVVEDDGSRVRQQTMKTTMAGNNHSKEKQQPKKRAIFENHTSREERAEEDESMARQESASKKPKKITLCRSMLIDEFLKENGEVSEELQNESADEGHDVMEEEENAHQEGGGEIYGDEHQEEAGEINGDEIEGTSKKRTRGPTRCLKIHARPTKDRQEVTLDDDGEPIGPDDKTVSDLSYFLGTIARNADFCPLIYTNFKALLKDHKARIWKYVNGKYIISDKGQKAIFSRINDAWRRYKSFIKRRHFLKYTSMKERLKHRPQNISESHFRKLMAYWKNDTIQSISQKNAENRAKQKFMHRVGPVNFARIRAKLLAKKEDGEEVSQAEMFIETRKSRKGKTVDEETQIAIDTLQESIENPSEDMEKAFQSFFGKEKPGRVRSYGRTMTPSLMKKNEEIASIKKQYSNKITALEKKMQTYDVLLKCVLMQQRPDLSEEAVDNLMQRAFENDNSAAPRSSTSTNAPVQEKVGNEDGLEEEDFEDFEE